jgi:hypothetical protein
LATASFLEQVFGSASQYYVFFRNFKFRGGGVPFEVSGWDLERELAMRLQDHFHDEVMSSVGLLEAAQDELKRRPIAEVYQGKDAPKETSAIIKIINLAEQKLRKGVREPPERESEVQNAFETLLIGADIPYHREFPHIEYSSKQYIPDFSFETSHRTPGYAVGVTRSSFHR